MSLRHHERVRPKIVATHERSRETARTEAIDHRGICDPGVRRSRRDRRCRVGCARRRAALGDAVRLDRLPARAPRLGKRGRAHRLGAALPCARARRRAGRRLPALPQGPLVRRVRVRLGLGRRLPASRPRLLPEAARRGALHAGSRPAPAGARERASARCFCARSSSSRAAAGLSSAHLLFLDDADQEAARAAGWSLRTTVQFHWTNRTPSPYADFADFLASLQRDKRKKIQQEQRRVAEAGVTLQRRQRRRDRRAPTGTSSSAATPSPTARTTRRPI